ncbi:hypothetical protein ACOMHN_048936 [Nucella lapillus]
MCVLKLGGKHKKQGSAMNKLTNIVHSGWMTKSPPEQRLQSPLKIFRAKWKQRFFVVHKPTGSLPDQYEMSYYNSEQCSKKKGSIDLDQCEQIIESLDSDQYPYLLAIKTICRSKVRTYYLATKSEDSMNAWVQCLCRVCGLKQEDTPTDIPDIRHNCDGASNPAPPTSSHTTSGGGRTVTGETVGGGGGAPPPHTVTSQPTFTRAATVASSVGSNPSPSTSPQSYLFLNDCTTGTADKHSDRYGRTDSVDSVPEYEAPPPPTQGHPAPPPPQQHHHQQQQQQGRVDFHSRPRSGHHEVYDRPMSGEWRGGARGDNADFYKPPPPPVPAGAGGGHSLSSKTRNSATVGTIDLNSAVPLTVPRRSPRSARSSVSERPESVDSLGQSLTECYDVPPPSSGPHDRPVEVYDVPPPGLTDRPVAEAYRVPPPGFSDRPMTQTYDIPPPGVGERPAKEIPSAASQEERGVGVGPLSSSPTPPQRPPKPHSLRSAVLYQNMNQGGGGGGGGGGGEEGGGGGGLGAVPAAPSHSSRCTSTHLSYDVPRASSVVSPPRDSGSILDLAPPTRPMPVPRNSGSAGPQAYQNTPPPPTPTPVLPPFPESHHQRNGGGDNRREVPAAAREPFHTYPPRPADMVKTSRGGGGGGGRGSRGGQDLYQVPPVAPPRIPHRSGTAPPNRAGDLSGAVSEEIHYIWSNTRTKSFKKNHQVHVNSSAPRHPSRPPLPLRSECATSSDDDDDVSVDGNDIQTHVDPGTIRMSTTVPTPSQHELEPELKYLDLALDTPPDPSRPQAAGSYGKGTEYREIDFDKTQALQEAFKARHLEK